MSILISSIQYCPIKSLSFQNVESCDIKKDLGILNDRMFAFSRSVDIKKSRLIEKNPNDRKLNYFLTLKNSPVLNKYNFLFKEKKLTLFKGNKNIISISSENPSQYPLITKTLIDLEDSLEKPIFLLRNKKYPFFDTTHCSKISNTISLININSIKNFEKKINKIIEFERFRGNLYIDGIDPWEERKWIGKVIKINNVLFRIKSHIPRCSAINLKPKTENVTINLPMNLKKHFNHFDMGIYMTPLDDGEINIGDKVILDE